MQPDGPHLPRPLRRPCRSTCSSPTARRRRCSSARSQTTLVPSPTGQAGSAVFDNVVLYSSVPVSVGVSRVLIGNVLGTDGGLHSRVFVVCFDTRFIFVYDPAAITDLPQVIRTGRGPHAISLRRVLRRREPRLPGEGRLRERRGAARLPLRRPLPRLVPRRGRPRPEPRLHHLRDHVRLNRRPGRAPGDDVDGSWVAEGETASRLSRRVTMATLTAASGLVGALAQLAGGCQQSPIVVPVRSLERSGKVSFVCLARRAALGRAGPLRLHRAAVHQHVPVQLRGRRRLHRRRHGEPPPLRAGHPDDAGRGRGRRHQRPLRLGPRREPARARLRVPPRRREPHGHRLHAGQHRHLRRRRRARPRGPLRAPVRSESARRRPPAPPR